MITKQIHITNPSGLHARPASDLSKTAQTFSCKVDICFNGKTKSAKSTIGILALGIKQGSTVDLCFDGVDEAEAAAAIADLAAANFHET